MSRARLCIAIAVATFTLGARAQSGIATIPATNDTATPIQRGLRAMFAERAAAGLPVPASAEYTYEVVEGAPATADGAAVRSLAAAEAGRSVTIVGRAVLSFDEPEQAGYDLQWPRFEIRNSTPPGAGPGVIEGDYTEAYRALAEQQVPGVWDQFEFGREPRTYEIEETITVTFPEGSTAASALAKALATESLASGATLEQILLGFTYEGPHIDHTIGARVAFRACLPWPFRDICFDIELFEFKAGFELSWAFGLRLPVDAAMSGPLELVSGSSAPFHSDVAGMDWSEGQYLEAVVAAEGGSEFVFRAYFFAGVKVEIFNADACTPFLGRPCYVELDVDGSSSFATPFGAAAFFPISPMDVPIYSVGIEGILSFELGMRLTPLLGSDRITAAASVTGGSASGGGPITYTAPDAPVGVEVSACIVPGASREASVYLDDFRYWFNRFLIDLGVYGAVDFLGNTFDPGLSIYTFDLSNLFDGTVSLGSHVQCDADFDCSPAGPDNVLALSAYVVDQAPPLTTLAIAGTAGNAGWYLSDLTLTLAATDNPTGCGSGVAATEYMLDGVPSPYAAPIALATEGATPFFYGSRDVDGNAEVPLFASLQIDKTAPVISGAPTTSPSAYGWFGDEVVVHFTASDAIPGSGIDTVTRDQTLPEEGAGQSVVGTATDVAGNSASTTVSGIHIDLTPPVLAISSPQPIPYPNVGGFDVAWAASDALSGIADESGSLDGVPVGNGEPVELLLFVPGPHVVSATTADKADHEVSASVTFDVTIDVVGLLAAQARICELDWINKFGICNSLEAKLLAAQASMERGDLVSAANQLVAYVHELDAQWNKAINPQAYELLLIDVQYVLAHLG